MELDTTTPLIGISKHLLPGTRLVMNPIPWHVRPLEWLDASFRMRHHSQMSSICRANTSKTFYATVGVHRINFCWFAVVINVSQSYQVILYQAFVNAVVPKGESTLTMCYPNTKRWTYKSNLFKIVKIKQITIANI